MKKILKNAFGFGLVEVLMAAGLAGGIALTIAKLSQDANRVTKTTETNVFLNIFFMLQKVTFFYPRLLRLFFQSGNTKFCFYS